MENVNGWYDFCALGRADPFVGYFDTTKLKYDQLGAEKVEPLFGDKHTRLCTKGKLNQSAKRTSPIKPSQALLKEKSR